MKGNTNKVIIVSRDQGGEKNSQQTQDEISKISSANSSPRKLKPESEFFNKSLQSETNSRSSSGSYRSIIAGKGSADDINRQDVNGMSIRKGSKKHKISFMDQMEGKKIAVVHEVESYKEYNSDENTHCCRIL